MSKAEGFLKALDDYIQARIEMAAPLRIPSTLIVTGREQKLEEARTKLLPLLESFSRQATEEAT